MMDHPRASELLGAYALDAVDPDEAASIEEHLESCPRCRDELRGHREVVGLLANAGEEAPEGLWDRVVAGIGDAEGYGAGAGPAGEGSVGAGSASAGSLGAGGSAETPLSLRIVRGGPGDEAGDRGPGGPGGRADGGTGGGRPDRAVGPRRWSRSARLMSLAAAAAVVLVALLGIEVVRLQDRTNHLSGEVASMSGQPTMASVQRAVRTPGARIVALTPPSGGPATLEAVILPGGQGYLYDAKLTPLSPEQTYQLWGVVGDQKISYGVLGATPAQVMAFRASSGVKALAVTAEVAGGVVTSTARPVAVGLLS